MEKRCQHRVMHVTDDGFYIFCMHCGACWEPKAVTHSQRLRCETGASGPRHEPGALVQLAMTVVEQENEAI